MTAASTISAKPLERFALVDTLSPDEAREQIGRIFCRHRLVPSGAQAPGFHARHHSLAQKGGSSNFVSYGCRVEIDPGELDTFFLLQIPVSGHARVQCGSSIADASAAACASLLSPTLKTLMTWDAGCEKIIVRFNRDYLETLFEAATGQRAKGIEFETSVSLLTDTGRIISQHASLLLLASEVPTRTPQAYIDALRESLALLLLGGQCSNVIETVRKPPNLPTPAKIKAAEAYIQSRASTAISIQDVANEVGISIRSLQEAFKRYRGETMTDLLRRVRLENFRNELLNSDPDETVTEIAFRVGLGHLGRAAAAYKAHYGETPIETRLRARRKL